MNKEDASRILSMIDDAYIDEAAEGLPAQAGEARPRAFRRGAAAALAAALAIVCSAALVFAGETK